MKSFLAGTLISLLLALGCSPTTEPPAQEVDLEAQRASLMEADRAFFEAYSTSDSHADVFVEHTVEDGYLLAPEAPIARGEEEIRDVIAEAMAMPGLSLTWRPSTAEVGSGGDLGYTIGTYQMQFENPEGNPVAIDGKYLTVWEKQPDGTWKVAADVFNANGPPSPVGEEE